MMNEKSAYERAACENCDQELAFDEDTVLGEIRKVYKWQNGMVMVFDQFGEQMPDYQGRYEEVREKILSDASVKTEFFVADWRSSRAPEKIANF